MSEAQRAAGAEDVAGLIEQYYERGFTDGLPVMPPSEASVGAMLAAAGLRGDEVLVEVPQRHVRLTADKAAVNAVLAGCRPEYMPVVVAALKAICHPDYGYHGPATSTGGAASVIIVNGPIAERLGINGRDNAFGPGWRANATIGRAVRLTMMNAINTRPGALDRSTLGQPGKYTFCFAENEADSPWEPLHVSRGFRAEESTVTVLACEGTLQVYNQLAATPEQLLPCFADAMSNLGSMNIVANAQLAVVFAGEHAAVLRGAGWSRAQVQQFLYEHARRSLAELKRAGRLPGPEQPGDNERYRHAVKTPEDILLVSAGGRAGTFSCVLPGWGSRSATQSVTLPVEMP